MRKCENCNHYKACLEWYCGSETEMPNFAENIKCEHYDSFAETELPKTEQNNAELIRSMPLELLNTFLWRFKVDAISSFMLHGGEELMDSSEQKAWLKGNDRTFLTKLFKKKDDEDE